MEKTINYFSNLSHKLVVKKDYMNVTWLHHQYYELRRSLQDIASNQGVSMITIKKWVDELEQ